MAQFSRRNGSNSSGKQTAAEPGAQPHRVVHDGQNNHAAESAGHPSRDKALLDSDFDPHVILRAVRDAEGHVTDFLFAETNDEACHYNGLTRAQLVGHRVLELFPNAKEARLFEMAVRSVETGRTLEQKAFSYPHDTLGEDRVFDLRAVPIGDELACTWRDVTSRPLVLERRKDPQTSTRAAAYVHDLQALAHRLIESGERREQVISRELHDNIAQVLAAATARISMAKEEKIPAWLQQELTDLREQLKSALADVRTLARGMRPALLDHFGLVAALEKHAEAFRERTRMTLDVKLQPVAVDFLDSDDLTHLFRLTQEALQNIEEHSGAGRAWIRLDSRDSHVVLEIGDDGCSFGADRVTQAQADGHLGLLGMRERAELLGGHFHLEAKPGQGTTIRVEVPAPGR